MSSKFRLTPHPRLYLRPADLDRLTHEPQLPALRLAARHVVSAARRALRPDPVPLDPDVHNGHLIRARHMQTRILTLLTRFQQTRSENYRLAVLRCVDEMNRWEHWSWLAWRAQAPRDAYFDLSYGENSATLAIAYSWLHHTLSPTERKLFLDPARSWAFPAALKRVGPGLSWWFGHPDSNWNTVCAGGLGMLCLAMFKDLPEAAKLLPLCEKSIKPYFFALDRNHGAWPEGIGYWNYGMRYAFMYLLSHEAATGRTHPLMKLRGTRLTLAFPLDFCPNRCPSSFGDVNHWTPLPFHYAAARRLHRPDVLAALDRHLDPDQFPHQAWPNAAELLALHPGSPTPEPRTPARPLARLYHGPDWALLADRPGSPNLYASIRGGATGGPHDHNDLLSFHVVVGPETLITDVKGAEYLDTTFSPRRNDLFEISANSKNTLFVNGVSIAPGAKLDSTTPLKLPHALGFRLDASNVFGPSRDTHAVRFCARVFLLLDARALLVIDRVELPFAGRVEARFHSFANIRTAKSSAVIRGRKNACRLTFASDVPALLATALTAQTTPTAPSAHVLRWCTGKVLHHTVTFATLITPTASPAKLTLTTDARRITLTASAKSWRRTVSLSTRLRPPR